jgi:hypothetical protein
MRRAGAVLAALAFLVWHGAAITLAPYPASVVRRRLRPLVEPYLRLAYLDHRWTFFAPHPDPGRWLGYEIVGEAGGARVHPLSAAVERRDPAFFRYRRQLPVCVAPVGRGLVLGARRASGPPAGSRAAVCRALVRWQMVEVFFFAIEERRPQRREWKPAPRPVLAPRRAPGVGP